jgi:hypothetical protein
MADSRDTKVNPTPADQQTAKVTPQSTEVQFTDINAFRADAVEREVFNPDANSAWPGASAQVYVSTHRSGSGSVQIGYDPTLQKSWVRARGGDPESQWGTWTMLEAPSGGGLPEGTTRSGR